MAKIYATRMILNNTCYMAKDYSHTVNGQCLGCHFCYKYLNDYNDRIYQSQWIEKELEYNKDLYLAPIFISRYCEPFIDANKTKHSLSVAQQFLENKSQVIFNTYAPEHFDNIEIMNLIKKYNRRVMIRFKVFNSEMTETSKIIKNTFCPNVPPIKDVYNRIEKYDFVDRSIVVDPYIIGVNSNDVLPIIDKAIELGIKKIHIRQLFATGYFKNYLYTFTGKSNYLTEKAGEFWTYDNHTLLKSALPIIEKCYKNGIDIQFCMNKELNKVLNNKKYNNCCMLNKPIGVYNINKNPMDRNNKGSIIK
jgi:DNA repair photolyase